MLRQQPPRHEPMYPFDGINIIKQRLITRHQTVAVAESVTSGHLQAALSLAENARQFYQVATRLPDGLGKCQKFRYTFPDLMGTGSPKKTSGCCNFGITVVVSCVSNMP